MAHRIPIAKPKSGAAIDAHALSIIQAYQPNVLESPMPFDIESFFELDLKSLTGVRPDYQPLPPGIYGYTDIGKMVTVISSDLVEKDSQADRRFRRTTMSHETGHAVQHVPEFRRFKEKLRFTHNDDSVTLKLYREEFVPIYRNPEWQAWRFAKALLMPASTVVFAVQEGYSIYEMVEAFDVHRPFVESRLKELKLRANVRVI